MVLVPLWTHSGGSRYGPPPGAPVHRPRPLEQPVALVYRRPLAVGSRALVPIELSSALDSTVGPGQRTFMKRFC